MLLALTFFAATFVAPEPEPPADATPAPLFRRRLPFRLLAPARLPAYACTSRLTWGMPLGQGRYGQWSLTAASGQLAGSACPDAVQLSLPFLPTAAIGVEWTPTGSPISLFGALSVPPINVNAVRPGLRAMGFMATAGLRVHFGERLGPRAR